MLITPVFKFRSVRHDVLQAMHDVLQAMHDVLQAMRDVLLISRLVSQLTSCFDLHAHALQPTPDQL
jgi:hypothetical protein